MLKTEIEQLLPEVKAYLNISWDDDVTDNQISLDIEESGARLEAIYGHKLNFVDPAEGEVSDVDYLARGLLRARCFYAREKALDDFEPNYRGDLLYLAKRGKVRSRQEKEESDA